MARKPNLEKPIIAFWFRRDLRLEDNAGLFEALQAAKEQGACVLPIFIFDTAILSQLSDRDDKRVTFIHQRVLKLDADLKETGSALLVANGEPHDVWQDVTQQFNVISVYTNHDYEPYAITRDKNIAKLLKSRGIEFKTFKDQVIFEKLEIAKADGKPYTVFSAYAKKWKATFEPEHLRVHDCSLHFSYFYKWKGQTIPSLRALGFIESEPKMPLLNISLEFLKRYEKERDFPALDATSRIGLHLRFGTISVREIASIALKTSGSYLNELIWREFFMQILSNFPHVATGPFRPEYAKIKWRNNKEEFARWCEGKTGYPIVDAGMRELNASGFMHNRVRMIAASFFVKHLLIDWRWGEAYFARKLLDFELASNNGNWQWVAGCGTDAAPYFRVFNPDIQTKKFDPKHEYIKKWAPEFGTDQYPEPIVDHVLARTRTLRAYKQALGQAQIKKNPQPRF